MEQRNLVSLSTVGVEYEESDVGTYRLLADFFRMAGIHVYGFAIGRSKRSYDLCFTVTSKAYENSTSNAIKIEDFETFKENGSDVELKESVYQYLRNCLEKMNDFIPEYAKKEMETLQILAGIFADYDLLRYFNVYRMLCNNRKIVDEAQTVFATAYRKLRESREERRKVKSKIFMYAEVNLAYLINDTCKLLDQRIIFDTVKCCNLLDETLVLDPAFYSAYVLKAYMCELEGKYNDLSEAYYKKALDLMTNGECKSYLYYRMGRYAERIQRNISIAEEYYRKAYDENRSEYRAIYKLALSEISKKHYLEAAEYCNEISRIMVSKKYLQPREQEFLFKAVNTRAKIYIKFYTDSKALVSARQERTQLYDEMLRENQVYKLMFGEKAEEYSQLMYDWFKNSSINY